MADLRKLATDIWSNLWVTVLSAPIVWVGTVLYADLLSSATSAFDASWFKHYWPVVMLALVAGGLQFYLLWTSSNRVAVASTLFAAALFTLYAWKHLTGANFPWDWPLWIFFALYCLSISLLAFIFLYVAVAVGIRIYKAGTTPARGRR